MRIFETQTLTGVYTGVVGLWAISGGKRKWGGSDWIVSNPWDRILGLRSSCLGIPAAPLIIQSRKYLIHRVGLEGLFTQRILEFINEPYISVTYVFPEISAYVQLILNNLRRFQRGEFDAGDFNAGDFNARKSCRNLKCFDISMYYRRYPYILAPRLHFLHI